MIEIKSHCVVCGDEYAITHTKQKTCSLLCEELLKAGISGCKCTNCGKMFKTHYRGKRLTCSEKCRREQQARKKRVAK